MKLGYWKVQCANDSDVYSIRTKTLKEAVKILRDRLFGEVDTECLTPVVEVNGELTGGEPNGIRYNYHYASMFSKDGISGDWDDSKDWVFEVERIEMDYSDGFDLMDSLINREGGGEYFERSYDYTLKQLHEERP